MLCVVPFKLSFFLPRLKLRLCLNTKYCFFIANRMNLQLV